MNYTQNERIEQVSNETLVIGIDIGSQMHYARAFDNRGKELTKRVFSFKNDIEGFNSFDQWAEKIKTDNGKNKIMIGCEPTGHYWFAFAKYVTEHKKTLVMVNPFSVKKIKELDDNSPKKTDEKDPKTIAKLVVDGRYSIPYMPEGIYAEIRDLVYSRDRIVKQHNISANRIQRWLAIHFPEYLGIYTRFDSTSGLAILKKAPLPKDVIALGVEGVRKIWHDSKIRGRGVTEARATTLIEAAHNSVGLDGGAGTRSELYMLLEEHRLWTSQLETVEKVLSETVRKVKYVENLLAIKGVGVITIAGFIAEVGDIRRFKSPKQIQKYAGLELVENSSGKHKGKSRISKRGRRKLRRILYQVMIPLLARNKEFREIYDYYITRVKNPLKRRQAMVAVGCKLIRVFYAVLTKGVGYDRTKMKSDIHRSEETIAA
ncbi:MAG: IS110 family transposase [Lachnospiraceae bacterium]|nr:IS110 family transposase [Lachnospiraceae bacterium]